MSGAVRVGLIGYGLGGSVFHAPLIRAVKRLTLSAVATSRHVEGVPAVRDPAELIGDPDIDLVAIASPNDAHFPLAQAALNAGKHVVVDKPFTLDLAQADSLIALARQRERLLTVFHNRRWDGDFLTVSELIAAGRLGEVRLFEAFWDRFRPNIKAGWREVPAEGAGLLNDLGPHLIDQALNLFGLPEAVTGDVAAQRAKAQVDDYFHLTLHYGRLRVVLGASTLVAAPRPRFAVHGTNGSFVKYGVDPQEARIKTGRGADAPGLGDDVASAYGTFTSGDGAIERIATQ
ncbi:MAG TPA: oxidoreductase, partial [Allosphingosinicella sp.]|nr:oxidoreductase [Allosphingosinicella sp.]